mmetsp:Transcript_10538/g.64665  ORF Transcript_10538/g.64665 Transcript_10538/m.64665 type:complete len:298 (+) Transcript_10538:559-1452(+)
MRPSVSFGSVARAPRRSMRTRVASTHARNRMAFSFLPSLSHARTRHVARTRTRRERTRRRRLSGSCTRASGRRGRGRIANVRTRLPAAASSARGAGARPWVRSEGRCDARRVPSTCGSRRAGGSARSKRNQGTRGVRVQARKRTGARRRERTVEEGHGRTRSVGQDQTSTMGPAPVRARELGDQATPCSDLADSRTCQSGCDARHVANRRRCTGHGSDGTHQGRAGSPYVPVQVPGGGRIHPSRTCTSNERNKHRSRSFDPRAFQEASVDAWTSASDETSGERDERRRGHLRRNRKG